MAESRENLKRMVAAIRGEHGIRRIILITPPPVYEPARKESQIQVDPHKCDLSGCPLGLPACLLDPTSATCLADPWADLCVPCPLAVTAYGRGCGQWYAAGSNKHLHQAVCHELQGGGTGVDSVPSRGRGPHLIPLI